MRIRNWDNFLFIAGYHVLLVALLPLVWAQLDATALLLWALLCGVAGISITAGYHRLFSHKTYTARPAWEWLTLLGATLATQSSALIWSHDHRLHHRDVDTDADPYSIRRGFWYAHVGWLFEWRREFNPALVPDLMRNPRVMFQHNHLLALSLAANAAVFALGCLFLPPLAAFYATVVLRIFAVHHATWFINSLAHTWGARTYAKELTAVDNAVLALLTFGEGYHNYHHAFASDYRNGIRWYHFDPTKWLIWLGARIGLTGGLRTVNRVRLQSSLVQRDRELLRDRLAREIDTFATELRGRLDELAAAYESAATAFLERRAELRRASAGRRELLRVEVRRLRRELRARWKAWLAMTQLAAQRYSLAH